MNRPENDANSEGSAPIQYEPPRATRSRFFVPDDVARDIKADFLDETTCRVWILAEIHGLRSPKCPKCTTPLMAKPLRTFWEGGRVRCIACGKFYTALTGTFLSGCHLTFQEIILLSMLLYFNAPAAEIARILDISQETVRLWGAKFDAMQKIRTLGGPDA